MIAINHALTGALIGLVSGQPLVALPAALLSHFVCDALPHYGNSKGNDTYLRSKTFATQLTVDISLCFALVLVLFVVQPQHWLLASFCAFIATSPDFAWLPGYIRSRRGGSYKVPGQNWAVKAASTIQWFERPIGGVVEAAWGTGAIVLLVAYL